jgi:hypothetical protein
MSLRLRWQTSALVAALIAGAGSDTSLAAQSPEPVHDGYQKPPPLALLDDKPRMVAGALATLRLNQNILVSVQTLETGRPVESTSLTTALIGRLTKLLPDSRFVVDASATAAMVVYVYASPTAAEGRRYHAFGAIRSLVLSPQATTDRLGWIGFGQTPESALDRLVDDLVKYSDAQRR